MANKRGWTYYSYESLAGSFPTIFYRRRGGVSNRLDRKLNVWVPADDDRISRYLELGEIGLDETTSTAIEQAIGAPLPG